MAQNNYGGPEHGVIQWPPPKHPGPSHGFDQLKQFGSGVEETRRNGMRSPPVIQSDPPSMFTHNSKSRRPEKRIKGRRWSSGGPGMQAIFLGSGPRSSGTGVFLPLGNGPGSKSTQNKPAAPPVLLPTHIVQALNLNVLEVGQQIMKPPLPDENFKVCAFKTGENLEKTAKEDNLCLSSEFNLPEEWTY